MADETVKQTKETARAANAAASASAQDFAKAADDISTSVRKAAEQSVTQMRKAYDNAKTAAETATDMLEDTFSNASDGWTRLNLKALDNFKAQTDANFAFARALFSAKTPAEAFETHVNFARDRMQTLSTQVKDFAELAGDIATSTARPAKESMAKTMKSFTQAA